ncbi:MAG TPA: HAMP domain-containing sensor histidine kinase [Anaerolineaceae bacterium]|nr:HAMP domain-containing sensor histidine kinase [Anaerolineaceae bacterium]
MPLSWAQGLVLIVAGLTCLILARKLRTNSAKFTPKNWLLFAVIIALTYLVNRFVYIVVSLPAISGSFDSNPVFFSLLGIVPAVLGLGFLGIFPALFLGLLAGITQILIHDQSFLIILIQWAFILLLAEKFSKPEERGNRSGLTMRFVLSLLELLPVLLVGQLFLQLLEGNGYLFQLIQFSLNAWVSILPGLAISILLIHGLNFFSPLAWKPSRFIRSTGSRKAVVDFATRSIDSLAKGNLDLPTAVQVNSLQEEVLLSKIVDLRDQLATRQDLVNKALGIQLDLENNDNRAATFQELLYTTLTYGADSSRLLIFNANPNAGSTVIKEKFSVGQKTEAFAPMDAILLSRLDKGERLMLTDLKAKQYFGIDDDFLMPKSLLAYALELSASETMLFWIGFQDNHMFNSRETGFYEAVGRHALALLRSVDQLNLVTDQGAWLISTFDCLPQAYFVINARNKLVFANKKGNELIAQYGNLFAPLLVNSENEDFINFSNQNATVASSLSFRLASMAFHANYYPILAGKEQLGKVIQVINASEVSETDQQKVQFLTNISHDLQSPLKLMRGYLLLLKNLGDFAPEQQKYLEKIHANVDNMDILTHKLLSLEQLDARQTLSVDAVDIRQVVEEVISVLALQANQKKLEIHTDFSNLKSNFISADRVLLQEAVFNIIDNAIRFSNNGADIEISAFKDDDYAYIRVKDYGKGISLMDKEKVFNRFYRVDAESGFSMRGQGLGLSIAKEVAEKHGGRIDLQSKLGVGSTFTIVLPLRNLV